jgi:putative transposase
MAHRVRTGRKDGSSGPSAPKSNVPSRELALLSASALPRRKPRPRMGSFDYRGPYAYHIILLTQGRAPHFTDRSLGRHCVQHLRHTADRLGFRLLAFSLMPDHLHALVLGRHDAADLIRFVQRFKQVTAFDLRRETGLRLWQQSFYDHTLRVEEDLTNVAAYILGNPVRAGLAAQPDEYPLSGGEWSGADEAKAPSLLVVDGAADGAEAPSLRRGRGADGGRHG